MRFAPILISLAACTTYVPPGGGDDDDAMPPDCTGSHDEDSDGFADQCDNCPGVFNPEQADLVDGDQVGAECDPDNTRPDTLLAFDPLTDLSAWHPSSGFSGDGENAVSTGPFAIIERNGTAPRPLEIQVAVRLVALPGDNDGFAVTADADAGGRGVSCQILRTLSGDVLAAVAHQATGDITQSTPIDTVMPDAEVVIVLDYDGVMLRCTGAGTMAQARLDLPIPSGTIQMTSSISAAAHYVAIYQAANP